MCDVMWYSTPQAVRRWIVRDGFLILRSKVVRFSLQEAKAFYSMHSGEK